jgi:uncharacterized protein (TIGR01319 family)
VNKITSAALLIDFGSTYTKLRAIDLERADIIGSGQGPSTVTTDITVGMEAALADLGSHIGGLPNFKYRLATSSAAGGLRMVTVGLVKELTAEAARIAALGAGAKLIGTYAYRLTASDIAEIEAHEPDILLLAGGTDGGNEGVILHNSAIIAGSSVGCPVVVAGNRVATDRIVTQLYSAGKNVVTSENVMPEFNVLNIEPARAAIRKIFIDRIVHAKGIDRAAERFDAVLMPTPEAVMEGARLLADGTDAQEGLGPLLIVDIGGATTDVHSVASGNPTLEGAIQRGLPEPYVKRTVEGDLGMRHNALSIVEAAGLDSLALDSGLSQERFGEILALFEKDVERLPDSDEEQAVDQSLARAATLIAVRRHSGRTETVYTVMGPAVAQHGKDLSGVAAVIGTGGVLVHGNDPARILAKACADPNDPESLRPRAPRLLLDRGYLLYACGLLGTVEPNVALTLGLAHMHSLGEEELSHGRSSAAG